MTYKEAYDLVLYHAMEVYHRREAENVTRYLFEDMFSITNFEKEGSLSEEQELEVKAYAKRIMEGEPIQYITGIANFYGYNFKINKHALIPRPETEELVNWVLEDTKHNNLQFDVLDVGTGTGCIPITLKKRKSSLRIFGVEWSLDALNVARKNARQFDVEFKVYRMDFLDSSYWEGLSSYDIVICNPPYITVSEKNEMGANVVGWEPDMALFVPDDQSMIFYEKMAEFGLSHLKENGVIYMELNEFRAGAVQEVFESHGYQEIEIRPDLQGKDRMIRACRNK